MISFEDALSLALRRAPRMPMIEKPLERSLGFVLAQAAVARDPIPLFDQSSMDGFGVRVSDVSGASPRRPARLALIGTVRAGGKQTRRIAAGQAVKILTGGLIPPGVEAVVMKEDCEEDGGSVIVRRSAKAGENIRWKGEEFPRGARALAAGSRITPPVVGLLAALGYAAVRVSAKPRIALIVTGDELRKPGDRLKPGQTRDCNSFSLQAALEEMGLATTMRRRVRDDKRALSKAIAQGFEKSDVVLTVGGVSVGDYDYVKEAASELGVRTIFWRVAMKPGKPTFFGVFQPPLRVARRAAQGFPPRKLLFGLPGNPVAALVVFHQLVKPVLLKMQGVKDPAPLRLPAILQSAIRKQPGRMEWVRGVVTAKKESILAYPTLGQESHMLGGLAVADCLIRFPREESFLPKGASVEIEILRWR